MRQGGEAYHYGGTPQADPSWRPHPDFRVDGVTQDFGTNWVLHDGGPIAIVTGEGKDRKVAIQAGHTAEEAILFLVDELTKQSKSCEDKKSEMLKGWRHELDGLEQDVNKCLSGHTSPTVQENLTRKISATMKN